MEFDSIFDLVDMVQESAYLLVRDMDRENASHFGLDYRAGSLYVNKECIVVDKQYDRSLQYYGGFEYVDSEYRVMMGDYVIYLRDDGRVNDAIETYYKNDRQIMEDNAE